MGDASDFRQETAVVEATPLLALFFIERKFLCHSRKQANRMWDSHC